jgi:glycosyl transferase family 25
VGLDTHAARSASAILADAHGAPPVLLINLARRPDRLETMRWRLHGFGVEFIRIDAVDGATCDPGALAARFARPGSFGGMCASELACSLSHLKAFEHFLSAPELAAASHAIVLEDDVVFAEHAGRLLRSLDWLPSSIDLLKLDRERSEVLLSGFTDLESADSAAIAELRSDHSCAGAYVISRRAAKLALSSPLPVLPVDYLLFHRSVSSLARRLKPRQLVPPLAEQYDLTHTDSDIEPARTPLTLLRTRPRGLSKIRRELRRIQQQIAHSAAMAFSHARWRTLEFAPCGDALAGPDPRRGDG